MGARFRPWWQRARKPLEIAVLIVGCIVVIALLVAIVLAYVFNVDVSGLRGKTLWDWLQLLIIPAVLALGGYLFTFSTSRTEREIASDRQREEALQAYIDKISDLLLEKKLRGSADNDEVRNIARVRTLTVLPRLDSERKRSVIEFLFTSELINTNKPIINISGANLAEANLKGGDMSGTVLVGADLRGTNLLEADLREADLRNTNLRGAELTQADLTEAILHLAKVTEEQLKTAKSLKGATMPDGSIHP